MDSSKHVDRTGLLSLQKMQDDGWLAAWLVVAVEKFEGVGERFRLRLHNGIRMYNFLFIVASESSSKHVHLADTALKKQISLGS